MTIAEEPSVGLRDLRRHTGDVIARVRRGETIVHAEYGKPVARLVPVDQAAPENVLTRLAAEGRLRLATRSGYRPATLTHGDRLDQAAEDAALGVDAPR
ncbi:MAG TPA: type II toxin-antitoxin system prevent-host-death family antitoxin [Actinocrinis sp.]|nr:type II toxin-antitoxin system prevent-host-death family antitoxin [Actinocrinis sp.]